MMKKILVYIIALGLFTASCEKALMKPQKDVDNLAVFDEYATLVKEKYAMLDFKQVDIDDMIATIRPQINNDMTDKQLFDKLGLITVALKDGHSSLSEVGSDQLDETHMMATFDFLKDWPAAFDFETMNNVYFSNEVNPSITTVLDTDGESIKAIYGSLPKNEDLGYIWIPSWNVTFEDQEIEDIFKYMKAKKGMIFDIRQNTGGDPALATKFASYFLDKEVNTGFERFKIGPGKDDFKDSQNNLKPASSEYLFDKKVVVLIDRFVYSAALTFSYSLFADEDVTFVGQRAGGGSGSVSDGYLMNGWYWALSVSEYFDYKGRHLDNGFDPDVKVDLDVEDKTKDEIMDKAIEILIQ